MRPSEALSLHRSSIRHIVESRHACNPRVFGSAIHGNDTELSDLDILVDPLPKATLFDLGAIQIELEESLGVSVDVLMPADLPSKFRDQVLKEAVSI